MRKSEDDHLRSYYRGHPAPPRLVTRLADQARSAGVSDDDVANGSSGPAGWVIRSNRWWRVAVCIAFVAGVSAIGGYWLGSRSREPAVEKTAGSPLGPRLVAVKIHADWCRRCPLIAPTFDELIEEHGNEPLLFVTLDITDPERRQQTQKLVESLGIEKALDAPFESGMIKLIDRRDERVLAILTDRAQKQNLEIALATALDADTTR